MKFLRKVAVAAATATMTIGLIVGVSAPGGAADTGWDGRGVVGLTKGR